jgi:hypothetical protein
MNNWPTRFGLTAILTCCVFLAGCSSLPKQSTHAGPATHAYVISGNFTAVLEYSTASVDNGSLIGSLTLPASFFGYIVATDSIGQIYVSGTAPGVCRILIYPANATGAQVPLRTVDLNVSDCPAMIAVDPVGRLYTAGQSLNGVPGTISVYSDKASGKSTPLRTLTPSDSAGFSDLTADAAGNIFTAGIVSVGGPNSIQVYSPSATGTAIATRTITSTAAVSINGVAVDASGDIFADVQLDSMNCTIEEFAPGVDGPATPINTINLPIQSGTSAQGGPVRRDSGGNLFVSLRLLNSTLPPSEYETDVIYGFDATATGSPAPTVQIIPTNAFFQQRVFALN